MIIRDDFIRLLVEHHSDEIVVPLYQAAFEWCAHSDWPLTYYAFGAMGQGSSHGLGFALGVPERKTWVLDGDGSLLMNLGTLVTIAETAPANLIHFVFENGTYEANGAHPIPGQGTLDFAGIAAAAGIRRAYSYDNLDALREVLPDLLAADGPTFVNLKVVPGAQYEYRWDVVHGPESRERFRNAMNEVLEAR